MGNRLVIVLAVFGALCLFMIFLYPLYFPRLQALWHWMEGDWGRTKAIASVIAAFIGVFGALWGFMKVIGSWVRGGGDNGRGQTEADRTATPNNSTAIRQQAFEKLYLDNLDLACQELRLDLIAKPLGERRIDLGLSNIYRDQYVRPLIDNRGGDQPKLEARDPVPLMQAIEEGNKRRLVIRGKVGSGKSSFINFLAHCIVASHQGEVVPELPRMLQRLTVVRIPLRWAATRIDSDTEPQGLIWKLAEEQAAEHIQSAFRSAGEPEAEQAELTEFWSSYRDQLKQSGVILLDGIDEVSESGQRRQTLRTAITDFVSNVNGNAWVIVTSRPYAYEKSKDEIKDFAVVDLEPMRESQVRAFISHWYLAARQAKDWNEEISNRRAKQLADEIFSSTHLPALAETPLLLTLIIGLDYADIRLPRSRARLHEEAVQLMLQRWNQRLKDYRDSLGEEEQDALAVLEHDPEQLIGALQDLAYETYALLEKDTQNQPERQAQEDGALEFSDTYVYGVLSKRFGQSCDHDDLKYFLQHRSGILVAGSSDQTFQFAHKSFHEYLTARAIMQGPDWQQKIAGYLQDNREWWTEIFLLAAKKFSDQQYGAAVQFLSHLGCDLSDSPVDEEQCMRAIVIATAAVELDLAERTGENDYYKEVFTSLQNRLSTILVHTGLDTRHRAEAGRVLGELGDPRDGVSWRRGGDRHVIWGETGKHRHRLPDIDWVEIPIGRFSMGSESNDKAAYDREKPAHDVQVGAFEISRYPITNAQYRCFVEAGGYADERYFQTPDSALKWWRNEAADFSLLDDDETLDADNKKILKDRLLNDNDHRVPRFWYTRPWNNDNHPVVGVSWYEAVAFCRWLSECCENRDILPANASIRLPREAEWEYAARGSSGLQYAFAESFDSSQANTSEAGIKKTSAVGVFPEGKAFGLHDTTGNVWEWTSSRWGRKFMKLDFSYANWEAQDANRDDLEPLEYRILRGGSWDFDSQYARCASRSRTHPFYRGDLVGFRVVFSLAADS